MTWHLTEDELIADHYGDGDAGEAERIAAHLSACPACRAAWQDLVETYTLIDAAAVPEPGESFERVLWARVREALPARRSRWGLGQVTWVAAWAAMVLVMAGAGWIWSRHLTATGAGTKALSAAVGHTSGDADVPVVTSDAAHARERVWLSAVNDHLGQTEVLLVELLNAPAGEPADIDFERASAGDLLASGRLYRQTADQDGDTQVAGILDDLEGVLVEIARSPDAVPRRDVEAWRTRIHSNGLLFKVRAASHDIHDRQHELMTESE